jgi:hypothetical protein
MIIFLRIDFLLSYEGVENDNFLNRNLLVGADLRVRPAQRVLREATTARRVLREGLPLRFDII